MPLIAANGIGLEYEEFGDPSDPALLLIIGFGLQLTGWPVAMCQGLADRGYRVIRFDNRDTGLSQKFDEHGIPDLEAAFAAAAAGEPVAGPYTEEDMADDAAALLMALGIDKAIVGGMSMGGRIAQRLAIRHPELVAGLVVMMSTSGAPGLPSGDGEVHQVLFEAPDPTNRDSIVDLGLRIFAALRSPGFEADPEDYRRKLNDDLDRSMYLDGYSRNLLAMVAAPPFHENLKNLSVPTLVLHGADDLVIPAAAGEDVAARIPGAKLNIVEGWGHEVFSPGVSPMLIDAISQHFKDLP